MEKKKEKQERILLVALLTIIAIATIFLASLAQAQLASTTFTQPATQQLSFQSLNLQQPFLQQQTTFQQDPTYFYPYYAQDPSLQYGLTPEMCNKTGMDFIVEIMPDACQPAPVRSDLLEEQAVPVFCKLTGVKINPLIQVPYIERIDAKTELRSQEIMSVSYYPPGSALNILSYVSSAQANKESTLEGVPTMSNLGYLVIYLKQQPVEANMPESVKLEETLKLTYKVATTFGISQNSMSLRKMSDEEWQNSYKQYSFWQGKGYLRLIEITQNKAKIALYRDRDTILTSVDLGVGQKTEQEIKLPGFYCGAGVKLQVDEISVPSTKARLLVNGQEVLVSEGQKILNSGCILSSITSHGSFGSSTGTVKISCSGATEYLELAGLEAKLTIQGKDGKEEEKLYSAGKEIEKDGQYYYIGYIGREFEESSKEINSYVIVFSKKDGKQMKTSEKAKVISALNDFVLKTHRNGEKVCDKQDKIKQELQRTYKIDYIGANLWLISGAQEIEGKNLMIRVDSVSTAASLETTYTQGIETLFKEAIEAYESVDYSYPLVPSLEGTVYGIQALTSAANLAKHFGKFETEAYYLSKLITKYDGQEDVAGNVDEARKRLSAILASDYSQATKTISTKGSDYLMTLLAIEKPSLATQSVLVDIDGEFSYYTSGEVIKELWKVDLIDENQVKLSCVVENCGSETNKIGYGSTRQLSLGGILYSGNLRIEVKEINSIKEVQVTVLPFEERRTTEANFTVEIGIEKRAIQLNPEKTSEKIQSLNNLISKIENVKNTLGKVVETWKKACLVGGTVLWAKNFVQGLDGSALARRKVMDYWGGWCSLKENQQAVGASTVAGCYKAKEEEINNDVGKTKEAIQLSNKFIQEVKSKEGVVKKSGLFGLSKSIDQDKFFAEAQNLINTKPEYRELFNQQINVETGSIRGTVTLNSDKFNLATLKERGFAGTEDVKEIIFNLKMQESISKNEVSDVLKDKISVSNLQLFDNYVKIIEQKENNAGILTIMEGAGVSAIPNIDLGETVTRAAPIVKASDIKLGSSVSLNSYAQEPDVALIRTENVNVLLILEDQGAGGYKIKQAIPVKFQGNNLEQLNDNEFKGTILTQAGIQDITLNEFKNKIKTKLNIKASPKNCDNNAMLSSAKEIKFWESGPYEGQIAYMPVDVNRGWYIGTISFSGLGGELLAYKDISGEINTYVLANVGPNGKPDFDYSSAPGGDDHSIIVSLIQGQEVKGGGCISDAEAQALNRKAISCMVEATKQYKAGSRNIKTPCGEFKLGKPPAVKPTAQCEDFMTPTDCKIMYNLCDPVMCPSSRCDWGGRYPVDDVVSTGIIGSLLLCSPNFENGKGVVVPICLTGVHAGIDNLEVTLKLYRDCLQENVNTGKMTGICDQIYSIYLCELLWQTLDPLIKVGIPALTSSLTTRGGGEYALFGESWKNAMDSVNYFTQYYGVNTFQAFKERSTAQAGTEICKRFVSIAYPTQAKFWEEISKPESPTQFFATLQEMGGIGPSQSHYKIYYQIYAGQDQGVAYRIYLTSPKTTGYYMTPDRYYVPGGYGYLAAGEYLGESPDFIAPSGYREICVEINGQDHCGFGQVTTNFAIDELQNLYLKNQIKQNIKTTKDCISGTPSLIPSPSLNLQSMVQSMQEPAIYRKGIIRICSSGNPGASSEPNRYKLIGYCDNPAVGCYLDMNSVNSSISDLGIRAEIATYAEKEQIDFLLEMSKAQGLEHPDETRSKLNQIEKQINEQNGIKERFKAMENEIIAQVKATGSTNVNVKPLVNEMKSLITDLEEISSKALYDSEKARAQFDIAQLKEYIARLEGAEDVAKAEIAREKAGRCERQGGQWKDSCADDEVEIENPTDKEQHPSEVCCKPKAAMGEGAATSAEIVPFTVWPVQTIAGYNFIRSCYRSDKKSISIFTEKDSSVKAVATGKVVKVGKSTDVQGVNRYETQWVIIEHSPNLYTYYGHIKTSLKEGDTIFSVGDVIGKTVNIHRDMFVTDPNQHEGKWFYDKLWAGLQDMWGGSIGYNQDVYGMLYFRVFTSSDFSANKGEDPLCFFSQDILSQVHVPLGVECEFKDGQVLPFYKSPKCKAARGEAARTSMQFSQWPLDISMHNSLSSCYGYRTLEGKEDFTDGIDIYAPGGTPVYAVASGTVIRYEEKCTLGDKKCNGGFGNGVVIKHSDSLYSAYHHLSKTTASVGQKEVEAGQKIGEVGCTGYCTGNHLDFKIYTKESDVWRSETGKHPLCFFPDIIRAKINPTTNALTDTKKYPENENLFGTDDGGCNPKKAYCDPLTSSAGTQQTIVGAKCADISIDKFLVAGEVSSPAKLEEAEAKARQACPVAKPKESERCWWDSVDEICRSCEGQECDGKRSGFLGIGFLVADTPFKTLEECEDNNCLLETCMWDGKNCYTAIKQQKVVGEINIILNQEVEISSGATPQKLVYYLQSPQYFKVEEIESTRLSTVREQLLKAKQDFDEIKGKAQIWNLPDQVATIEGWQTKLEILLEKISVASSQVFVISSKNNFYSQDNKVIASDDNSKVCVIFEQDGVYYNDDLVGQEIDGRVVKTFESSATITWHSIKTIADHKAGGFTNYNFQTITDPLTKEENPNYYWYQNVQATEFWSQDKDTIQYQQVPQTEDGWCISVSNEAGVYRYRAEITTGNKVYSTPGKPLSQTGMTAQQAGYNLVFNGKENTLIEKDYYNFAQGGISNEVHRIARRSNYAQGSTDKNLLFIEYIQAYQGIAWIWGAREWQANEFIGMDCADLTFAPLNRMKEDDLLDSYVNPRTAKNLESHKIVGTYVGIYFVDKEDTLNNIYLYYDNNPKFAVSTIFILNNNENVKVGDVFLKKDTPASDARHTLVLYQDKGTGTAAGTLDKKDYVVYVGKGGITIEKYLEERTFYFVIRRLNELA